MMGKGAGATLPPPGRYGTGQQSVSDFGRPLSDDAETLGISGKLLALIHLLIASDQVRISQPALNRTSFGAVSGRG